MYPAVASPLSNYETKQNKQTKKYLTALSLSLSLFLSQSLSLTLAVYLSYLNHDYNTTYTWWMEILLFP